jgi:hypothetical protein
MINYFRRIVVKLNIARYEHEIVSMDDYLKVKADADRLAEALEELVSIVKIHSENVDYNFAWAEMPQARAALAAHERGEG